LRQASLNCAAGEGEKVSPASAHKAENLYQANFGLPVKTLSSDVGIHAVFMSGVRVAAKAKVKKAKKIKVPPRKGNIRIKKARKEKSKPKNKKK
jgi:hypothetical protein